MSFASFCVLLVSLLLIGTSLLFSVNVNSIVGSIENRNEVIVFLDDKISDAQIEIVRSKLDAMDNVSTITFYSKEEALVEYRQTLDNYSELFEYLDENPLPDSFRVRIDDVSIIDQTVEQISSLINVYSVKAPFDFANILTELKNIFTAISGMLIVALFIVSLVIISNTTRASAQMRKNEIYIMRYVGASNSFIKFPFFIEGMVIGSVSGLVASLVTWSVYDALIKSLSQEMYLWNLLGVKGFIEFSSIKLFVFVGYILAGAFVGAFGSVVSMRKYIKA